MGKKKKKQAIGGVIIVLSIFILFGVAFWLNSVFNENASTEYFGPVDKINDFNHQYGIIKGNTLAQAERSNLEAIDQIEEYSCAYAVSSSAIDYRTITGREGYEFLSDSCKEYFRSTDKAKYSVITCEYHQMVRSAKDPSIRKVIFVDEDNFYYVEVTCLLTLEESLDTYSKERWPDGIGSTIEEKIRLEFEKQTDGEWKITEVDIADGWDDTRTIKYTYLFNKIEIIE